MPVCARGGAAQALQLYAVHESSRPIRYVRNDSLAMGVSLLSTPPECDVEASPGEATFAMMKDR